MKEKISRISGLLLVILSLLALMLPAVLVEAVDLAPTITTISPATGSTTGGTTVTITGTGFTGATAATILFGGTVANGAVVTSTQITAYTPAHAAGLVDVKVTTSDGSVTRTGAYTYNAFTTVPLTLSLSADTVLPGELFDVTVTGVCQTGQYTNGMDIFLNFDPAKLAVDSWVAGTNTPTNFNNVLTEVANNDAGTFAYSCAKLPGPYVTGPFVPVIITFQALSGDPSTPITFSTTGVRTTKIDMLGNDITGTLTGASVTIDPPAAPTIDSIDPSSGPAAGGTFVAISGTSFTGATAVNFGDSPASGFTVNSDTQITATAPAGTGSVDVTVVNDNGTSATSSTDLFTYIIPPAPAVSGISPNSGLAAGGTSVTITGTNFYSPATVTIGGGSCTGVTIDSSTQIRTSTPSGTAGAKDVVVTTPGGIGTKTGAFTYVADPVPPVNNGGGGGGGGGGSSSTTVFTSIFGNSSTFNSNSAGVVQQAFTVTSTDGNMSLTIPTYTAAKNAAGTALTSITETINNNPPAPPSGNIIGLAIDLGPSGATFSPPITFVYHYTAADFAAEVSEANLTMAFYDAQTGTWVDLKQKYGADYVKVDQVNDTMTVLLPHFTAFAVMGKAIAPPSIPSPTATPSLSPTAIPSPVLEPSPLPTPTLSPVPSPAAMTVSSLAPVPPPPSSSLLPSSVTTSVTFESPSPAPATKPVKTFNWALVIGILAAVIVVMAVIMVIRRK